ncbi:MAG: hypothetical protein V2J20_10280 [Wenzhouxiangella sp.]|jgi:DNA repair exonuclease SbcCD ATPase subunit|nr:hypothetical protein [Wenzhouxiangella sp.]
MKLSWIDIRHLEGISEPFKVELAPDTANLVTGPNGSGKSSLIRAVRAVLTTEAEGGFAEIRIGWRDDRGEILAHRLGAQTSWTRQGRKTAAPNLPASDALDAFLISTEQLNSPGKTDALIAAELKTLLTGGYDLDVVLNHAALTLPPRPQKLAREIDRLHRSIEDKEQEYTNLQHEVDELADLEARLKEATEASTRIGVIEDAQTLADAIGQRDALESTLIEEFPGGMDRLRGDELERLGELQQQLERKQHAIVLEHTTLKEEQARLEDSGVDDPQALEALQANLADARDRLAASEQKLEAEKDGLEQAEQSLKEAGQRVGSEEPERLIDIDQAALESLEKQVEKVLSMRERIRALTGQLSLVQSSRNPTGQPRDDLRNAHTALHDWLALARLSPLEGWLWGTLSLAALIGGVRLLGGTELSGQPELLLLIVLAAGLPVAMLVRFGMRWRDRTEARRAFELSEIEPPLGWNESEVRARLKRLDLELEAATQREISHLRAGELRQELNAQRTSLDRARSQLTELATGMGLSAEQRLETTFALWSRSLQDWQQAGQDCERRRHRIEQLSRRYDSECELARKLLDQHGVTVDSISSREISRLVNELTPKMRRHAELYNSVQARNRRISEVHTDISQLRQRIQGIFDQAGMRPDDETGLRLKVEQLARWQSLETERVELTRKITQLEHKLINEPELLDLARHPQQDQLEPMREELAGLAEQRDDLNRRIAEIQTRHRDALARRELESLGMELEAAHDALETELERHLTAAAGRFLIEDVATAHRDEQEPALMARADHWLNRFTGHRYRLEFQAGAFLAADSRTGNLQNPAQLSTGTRAQLMLALRLAWIEQLETRFEPLPIFMDEALTTSDPDRYRAIVQATGELVKHGRQVFYMTAQSDERQAWQDWLGHGLKPHEIDMSSLRATQVRQLEFQMPEAAPLPAELPDPNGLSPNDWAQRAGIAAIDPWQDAGSISVFHLLRDDLGLVVRLMKAGLSSLGPLERLLELAGASGETAPEWLDQQLRQELGRRIQAVRLILKRWQASHSRPLRQADLVRSELITDRFLPRVAALNEELGGNPAGLISALGEGQVSRFRTDNLEQLEAWLSDQGFLPVAGDSTRPSPAELSVASGLSTQTAGELQQWIEGAIIDPLALETSTDRSS